MGYAGYGRLLFGSKSIQNRILLMMAFLIELYLFFDRFSTPKSLKIDLKSFKKRYAGFIFNAKSISNRILP